MCNCKYLFDLQDFVVIFIKQIKKDKKNKKVVNGEKKDDRFSFEVNVQEQMVVQRVIGGELIVFLVVVSILIVMLFDLFMYLFFFYIKYFYLKLRKCFYFVKVIQIYVL